MILIIGALASGKRHYATKTLGYSESELADAMLDDRPVVFNAQDMIKSGLYDSVGLLSALLLKEVVIINEVGSGVIPAAREDTAWRETVGKLACELAQNAESVVRMVCGIPVKLK